MEIRKMITATGLGGMKKAAPIKAKDTALLKDVELPKEINTPGDKVDIKKLPVEIKEKTAAKLPVPQSVKPEPALKASDLKPMPKDLYKVHSDGTTKKVTFIYDAEGRKNMDNLTLIGSWDKNTGHYATEWKESAVPMQMDSKGRWIATVELQNDGSDFRWGVLADAPTGKQQWAVFEENNLKVNMEGDKPVSEYAPTTYTRMGASRDENSINFKYWAPHAKDIKVKVWDKDPDKAEYIQLEKDPKTNMWSGGMKDGWAKLEGKTYAYEIIDSEGKKKLRTDPYARFLQGQQRGIGTIYLHPKTGKEVHQFYKDPELEKEGKPSFKKFVRFEVQGHEKAEAAYLTLSDESGKVLDKKALLERLGKDNPDLVKNFHEGKFTDFWMENIDDQGRISMKKQGNAWASIVNNPEGLAGLSYKFEIHETGPDGKVGIVGDANKDGVLSADEAKATAFNDPYSGKISRNYGWQRFGIIKEPTFAWKNDDVPRMTTDKNKMVIYQLHTGSIFGDAKNVDRSTFKDIKDRLKYFKELGVNTLEFLPVNTFEGTRDWGYIGTSNFAISDQYGFEDEKGNWVSGTDALKQFIDAAHGEGFNVFNDVVYNHWGGEFNNPWEHDGKKNSYFDWAENPQPQKSGKPEKPEWSLFKSVKPADKDETVKLRGVVDNPMPGSYRTEESKNVEVQNKSGLFKAYHHTPWGAMPAYNKEAVSQLAVDNAVAQLDEFHFDGLRFDFTHPIHDGSGGGGDGWKMLRKMNRQIHFFHPNAVTAAEEFPNSEVITKPAHSNGKGGAGFDQMWNTEFQHRLAHSNYQPSILQQAAKGWKVDMDRFMSQLTSPEGFSSYSNSTTVISNHDEVGNADRIVNTANNHQHGTPGQWARNASRFVFGTGMLAPGTPIFFQGAESIATNHFSWGRPSTWDVGWDWKEMGKDWNWNDVKASEGAMNRYMELASKPMEALSGNSEFKALSDTEKKVVEHLASTPAEKRSDEAYNVMRRAHNNYCRDIINLRNSSPAFDGDAEANRVYTHNENGVMAFHRKKNGEEFIVIGSLNQNNLGDYNIPLNDGKWQLVFNSDADFYGGDNFGSKIHVDGNQGSRFDIPKGGLLVYKKV